MSNAAAIALPIQRSPASDVGFRQKARLREQLRKIASPNLSLVSRCSRSFRLKLTTSFLFSSLFPVTNRLVGAAVRADAEIQT